MKNNTEATKEQTPQTQPKVPKAKPTKASAARKAKDDIAAALTAQFGVGATMAAKIVRRNTGRVRFFQRAMQLTNA